MKKFILTESQAKVLMEEIDKNDSIQKLIFSEPSDIKFEVSNEVPEGIPVSRNLFRLTPVIDGKEIGGKFVNFLAEEVKLNGQLFYQLHINVAEQIRRLGVAYKLYIAFIEQGYPVCSLKSNRTSTFYADNDSTVASDSAISGLWKKISKEPNIVIKRITNNEGNNLGIIAFKR